MPDGQRDLRSMGTVSPDRVSSVSSESATSVDHLEEAFVKNSKPRTEWATTVIPSMFKRLRPSRTSSAFQRWKGSQWKPFHTLLIFAITASIADIVLATLFIYYMIYLRSLLPPSNIQKIIASWGLSNYPRQPEAKLPADFSRDIVTIQCHSHNDYWRRLPLYDALAAGCTSVEADVWLSGNDLLVGHSQKALTPERTLKSLYTDPLFSILSNQNAPGQFTTTNGTSSSSIINTTNNLYGVFDTSPATPLVLLIDIKTDGPSTFPAVHEHLEPFRSRGWLSYFNGSAVVPSLITIVGTGKTPFDLVVANNTYRDIFYDAPPDELWPDDPASTDKDSQVLIGKSYSSRNSYYASVSFPKEIGKLWHGMLTPQQVLKIRGQVQGAEERGLKARYWDTPAWPVSRRDHVWDVLMKEGVGALNVDDLEAAKERKWGG